MNPKDEQPHLFCMNKCIYKNITKNYNTANSKSADH